MLSNITRALTRHCNLYALSYLNFNRIRKMIPRNKLNASRNTFKKIRSIMQKWECLSLLPQSCIYPLILAVSSCNLWAIIYRGANWKLIFH